MYSDYCIQSQITQSRAGQAVQAITLLFQSCRQTADYRSRFPSEGFNLIKSSNGKLNLFSIRNGTMATTVCTGGKWGAVVTGRPNRLLNREPCERERFMEKKVSTALGLHWFMHIKIKVVLILRNSNFTSIIPLNCQFPLIQPVG